MRVARTLLVMAAALFAAPVLGSVRVPADQIIPPAGHGGIRLMALAVARLPEQTEPFHSRHRGRARPPRHEPERA